MQPAPVDNELHSDSNLGFGGPAAKGNEVTDFVALVDTGLAIRGYSPLMQAALLDIQHIDEIYSKIIKEAQECMVIPPLLIESYGGSTTDRKRHNYLWLRTSCLTGEGDDQARW